MSCPSMDKLYWNDPTGGLDFAFKFEFHVLVTYLLMSGPATFQGKHWSYEYSEIIKHEKYKRRRPVL